MVEEYLNSDLIEQIKRRDSLAITKIVKAHSKELLRAAIGLGFLDSQADELVQRTWEAFLVSLPRFEARSAIRTFLFGILYNKARELRREDSRITPREDIDEIFERRFTEAGHWARPPLGPESALLHSEVMKNLAICLEGLSVSQRAVFVLQEIEGATHGDICKALDISVTNVGVLAHRARNRLRECIERKSGG